MKLVSSFAMTGAWDTGEGPRAVESVCKEITVSKGAAKTLYSLQKCPDELSSCGQFGTTGINSFSFAPLSQIKVC